MNSIRCKVARALGVTIEHKPYGDSMGFLPCDALGPNVYVVTTPEGRIGYSQLHVDSALDEAGVPDWNLNKETIEELCNRIEKLESTIQIQTQEMNNIWHKLHYMNLFI